MFASLDDPQAYLRTTSSSTARSPRDPAHGATTTLIDTGAEMVYEQRRTTVERARDLKQSAEMHRSHLSRRSRRRDPELAPARDGRAPSQGPPGAGQRDQPAAETGDALVRGTLRRHSEPAE
jgi:hypothetical protein